MSVLEIEQGRFLPLTEDSPFYAEKELFELYPWELEGPTADVLARLSQEMPEEDFLLLRQTAILAEGTGLDNETRGAALRLLGDFYLAGKEDAQFARGSMEALPIMLAAADVLEDKTGIPIDRAQVWLGVLHDVGKRYVPEDTKHKSNIGATDYSDQDMSQMERHVVYGVLVTIIRGVPQAAPLAGEHHRNQPSNPYEMNMKLTPTQERAVICTALGDHIGAARTRRNSRTTGMSEVAIWDRTRRAVEHILLNSSDFHDKAPELADHIMERGWSRQEVQRTAFGSQVGRISTSAYLTRP